MSNHAHRRPALPVQQPITPANAILWNGQPAVGRRVAVTVVDTGRFPQYWARDLVGQRRKAVEVTVPGAPAPFYLDDEDGSAWAKVTTGHGLPNRPHRTLEVTNVVPLV